MASVSATTKYVRPVLSLNKNEARKRVLALYKLWYQEIPQILLDTSLPVTEKMCFDKLREEFRKNANETDIRVIDFLIIKGEQDLQETLEKWKNKGQLMDYFKVTVEKKPSDFLGKFLSGQD
ncbi:NADH dehydrogenase [ubiquinone] 1 alpha subcomplex subunit 6 [Cephus cinctus]|uniref:NADH dehydrogenase [ubiquinone] 1 alpha subcomplex subunit 6 n=1 Tax=Cephus cinctus TaxID=211228 RepID=A0AAJ7C0Z0_CEPCN|nr:NADH dehydrogenase [ubiquinone] 1 alpha subcomplex subunit 6 [Cephus cinctus]